MAVSSDGNTALVGGPTDGDTAGAAWVFTRSSSGWSQRVKLAPTDAIGRSQLGFSVALSADGNTALVGGPGDDNAQGAAWIFTRSGIHWSEVSKLVGIGSSGASQQGWSVALSANGSTALIGAPGDTAYAGAAWVFVLSEGSWMQQGPKLADTAIAAARLGFSVSLSADGNMALLGGPHYNSGAGGAWVWKRSDSIWTAAPGVLAGTPAGGRSVEQGYSVAISADGSMALSGGPGDANGVGAAWVFALSSGGWSQQAKLIGSNAPAGQGVSVALSMLDGNAVAVFGAVGDKGGKGAAWEFVSSGGVWPQLGQKLVGTGALSPAQQGKSIAVSNGLILIGGNGDAGNTGAVWAFAPPAALSVSATVPGEAGRPFSITVTAQDAAGAILTAYSDSVRFTSSDTLAELPGNSTLTNASQAFPVTFHSGGRQTVTVTDTTYPKITGTAAGRMIEPPTICKIFGLEAAARKTACLPDLAIKPDGLQPTIPLNGSTSLTFYLTNPNSACGVCGGITGTLTGIGFTDSLPAGVVVATPSVISRSCGGGTITATAGSGMISLSGATLAGDTSCQFSVSVTGTTAGLKTNVTSAVNSNEGGEGNTATAILTVVAPPTIAKAFGAPVIPINGSTTLTFTLSDPAANTLSETGVAFTDTLPSGMTVAASPGITNTCGGTATAAGGSVSLTGGTIPLASACTIGVNVTAGAAGAYLNTTGAVSSTHGLAGGTASASLTVAAPPVITEAFAALTIPMNGSTALTFNLVNPAANVVALTGVAFTDSLPAGLVVSSPAGRTTNCSGTPSAMAGAGSVSLQGATLAANSACMLSVNVTGVAAGVQLNSVTVTSTLAGTGNTSQATVVVVAPPQLIKIFGSQQPEVNTRKRSVTPDIPSTQSIQLNTSTTLTFMAINTNTTASLSGVAFTDPLPAGLVVSTPNGLTGTCGGGSITATAGGASVALSDAALSAGTSCNFSVNVTGTAAGTKNNITTTVASNEGGAGPAATATLYVVAPPSLALSVGTTLIPLNGSTTLRYTITNPVANTAPLTGVRFTHNFPADLLVASPNGLTSNCGGTPVAVAGSGSVSLAGATVAPGTSCTLTLNVTVTAAQPITVSSVTVLSANGGTGNTASLGPLNVSVPITLNTVPAGLSILVNGAGYTNGQTLQLPYNTNIIISVVTPETVTPGTRYVFNNWSDGGAVAHAITVPAVPTTYIATFTTQYQLTVAVTPAGSGTVTPASGGFYNSGASVTLTATPNSGYAFSAWTGAVTPFGAASGAVVMNGPVSVTATFQTAGAGPPQIGSVLNSGSFQSAQAAPNTILSLFGTNLSCTPAPQVLLNNMRAQVLFASNTQINFVVPTGLDTSGNASVQVVCNGVTSRTGTLALSPANPAIFTLTENGTGQGAVLNLNYSLNGPQAPARPGSSIFVYGTGFGDLNPAGADGLQHLTLPVTATIGTVPAQVTYAGQAPGYTAGLQQINILIPENAPVGSAVALQLMVNGVSTQSSVTIAVQ